MSGDKLPAVARNLSPAQRKAVLRGGVAYTNATLPALIKKGLAFEYPGQGVYNFGLTELGEALKDWLERNP